MNNEQKKEYTAPKMEIIVSECEANLLCASGQSGEDCVGATWDNTEG
jgi:hypothetical protein